MKRKLFSMLLVLALCISCIAPTVSAAEKIMLLLETVLVLDMVLQVQKKTL